MVEMFSGVLVGVLLAVAVFALVRARRASGGGRREASVRVYSTIEDLRSVGELSVFKLITKEIVTATDHSFGEFGKKYFQWIVSSRKMAMIIAFDIDFRYDLQSPDFGIAEQDGGAYTLTMPKCFYETHIRDIHFYDEQNSKVLPWLLPDLLNRAFGAAFSEGDKNRLIEEAKQQASSQARSLVQRMRSDVQHSARQTIEALARGFGAERVSVSFRESELVQRRIEYESPDETGTAGGATAA